MTTLCHFSGIQDAPPPMEPVALFNLDQDIPGHPKGSTVTAKSIHLAGYYVDPAEFKKARRALRDFKERKCAV
jgi:hypothetical protein